MPDEPQVGKPLVDEIAVQQRSSRSVDLEHLHDQVESALELHDDEAIRAALEGVHAADLAEVYDLLSEEERSSLIYALPAPAAAEMITMLGEAEQTEAVEDMDEADLTRLASEMEPDDAADVLAQLTEEQRREILEEIPDEHADKIEELLTYEEDTAGGIMTKNLVMLPADATIDEAIDEIRSSYALEDLHYIYLIEEDGRFVGMVPLRDLVVNTRNTRLGTLTIPDPITVRVNDDQEEVARTIAKYDCVAVPVLDDADHLLGRITHDDIMDVVEHEADEDMYRMVGLDTAEFERSSLFRAAGIRLSWLVPCLVSMGVTAAVMLISQRWFEELKVYAALIVFVPMIGAIGGNCGVQISTVLVRGLATGELAESRFLAAFSREGRIALIMAPVCGVSAALICMFGLPMLRFLSHQAGAGPGGPVESDPEISVARASLAVGLGMTSAILIAASLGIVLPFLFKNLKVDPALASGPIVTTVNDILSVTVFLALSSLIMAS